MKTLRFPSSLPPILYWGFLIELSLLLYKNFTGMDRTKPSTTILFYLPFALFTLAYTRIIRIKQKSSEASSAAVLLFTLLFSLTFIYDKPNLSDDLYRYYWDGKVSNKGINPYSYAPNSLYLKHLRDEYWTNINNKDLTTPYPPFIEALFATLYFISPNIYSFKLLAVFSYLASSYVLILIFKKLNKNPYYSLLYSWNPLMAVEFGHSGHNDAVAVLFTLLCAFFLLVNQPKFSALTLGIGTMSKIFPVFLAPAYVLKWRRRSVAIYSLTVLLPYIPLGLTGPIQTSLVTYFERIAFNAGFYYLVETVISCFATGNVMLYARITVAALFVVLFAFIVFKHARKDPLFSAYLILTSYLLLTPTIHPWYLSWILPFASLYAPEPWIYFSGAIFLSYYTYTLPEISPGFWPEQTWVRIVEYLPFTILLLLSFRKKKSVLITA